MFVSVAFDKGDHDRGKRSQEIYGSVVSEASVVVSYAREEYLQLNYILLMFTLEL